MTSPAITGQYTVAQRLLDHLVLQYVVIPEPTSQPALSITQTWNAAGVAFTGIKANFTVTASNNSGLFLDLHRNGVSQFKVSEFGAVTSGRQICDWDQCFYR